ncbi:MAG: AAA family ATPase [Rhodospirillaceae bacterium]|nr:AAA family ATPase [Rhodospirillaceae bacterium]
MRRVVIIGNSGSGKSTLAHKLAKESGVATLDLDTIVWEPGKIAVPRAPEAAQADLDAFCNAHSDWIAEGCYGRLAEYALRWQPELIFVNPGEAACLANCRARPWEPHKYASKAEQDSKLKFLLNWVSDYYTRDGDMSLARHRAIFDAYSGPKREITRQ